VYELKAEQQAHAAKLLELTQQTPRKQQPQQQQQPEVAAGQAMSGFMAGLLLASKSSTDKMQAALGEQLGRAQETVEKLRQQAEEAAAAVARERQLVEKLRQEAHNSTEASRCAGGPAAGGRLGPWLLATGALPRPAPPRRHQLGGPALTALWPLPSPSPSPPQAADGAGGAAAADRQPRR
jgi:DNA-binding PucR family transcriptional regulator